MHIKTSAVCNITKHVGLFGKSMYSKLVGVRLFALVLLGVTNPASTPVLTWDVDHVIDSKNSFSGFLQVTLKHESVLLLCLIFGSVSGTYKIFPYGYAED
jgi:hypothetical protein